MKLNTYFFILNGLQASIILTTVAITDSMPNTAKVIWLSAVSIVCLALFALIATSKLRRGLHMLETSVIEHNTDLSTSVGIDEFAASAKQLSRQAEHWEAISEKNREQTQTLHEIHALISDSNSIPRHPVNKFKNNSPHWPIPLPSILSGSPKQPPR